LRRNVYFSTYHKLKSFFIVYSPEAGALLCQFFAYVRVPAMCSC
jgi:hypothetical protein